MQDAHFLAVKPLSVKTTRASCADAVILNVMRHNARELQAEIGIGAESGIDPSRIHLNVTLHGPATADGVASAARDAMREHGIVAPRKNATLGIEIVVSLPAGLAIDHLAYFRAATTWAQQHYGVPLLSAILHNDESSPHLHLVLLPVRGGKLVGSELLGNRATMKAMQKDFHDQVAKQYGLRMLAAKKRHSATERAAAIALLRVTLQSNSALTDGAIDALLVAHARNPEPLLLALGLAMPAPPVKGSFVATMTRKVRSESPNRGFTKSTLGDFGTDMAPGLGAENKMSYALLGLPISTPNISPQSAGIQATNHQHPADGLLTPQHTPAAADTLPGTQATSEPSTTGQAAPTSTSTTPARRKHTAANRQPAAASPASLQTVSLAEQASAGKLSDPPRPVRQLDTPAVDHHQAAAAGTRRHSTQIPGDLGRQHSPENSGQLDALMFQDIQPSITGPAKRTNFVRLGEQHQVGADDVSSFARISSPPTGQAKATQYVELVHHQADACEPSCTPRPKLSATDPRIARKFVPTIFVATSAPCANGMRTHKDVSKSGCISKGGADLAPPAGVPNVGQAHAEGIPNSGDTPSAGGDLLKTQQVDQQAGQADAHRCSPAGGGHPSPQRGMVPEAEDDYHRHRDDEQPAETWCVDLGEFVQATGPPCGACQLYPRPKPARRHSGNSNRKSKPP
ncbi:Plasmid recombination enzyme [Duganella sp. CF517]|uniref:plasmid recombination protein n=1 Tax=Duganella sp. CF517 TaxID=1881038 RepID=UPI0008C7310D|nr:plasmid recombination protein [Duganella sp. CF517]SEO43695.1 Plasmid recombination enzyme [Duganella sp. CF517]